jgi:hypothetical protein
MPVAGAAVIEGKSSALMVVVGRNGSAAEGLLGAARVNVAETGAVACDCVFSAAGVCRLLLLRL